jgi:hypothetical protein
MATIDWSDPCAALAALKEAKLKLMAGATVARVRFDDREVSYQPGSLNSLNAEIARLEGECAAKTGGHSRTRYAMTGGTRRHHSF